MSGAAGIIRAAPAEPCQPWPRHHLLGEEWQAMAAALGEAGAPSLLALWADAARVYALLHDAPASAWLVASTSVEDGRYRALSPHRPAAAWFERMIRDLWGHDAEGGRDGRPWLEHGRWPVIAPLSPRPVPRLSPAAPASFLPVEGEDYHQIPVGPVHAGIIEPGHFRFSALGETVVRLEIRLGWLHKGTLGLMRGKSPRAAARFAARLSGDSTVAHSVAFARAAEAATLTEAPPRAIALRAAMTELERVANHLGDCGAIAGDAAFMFLPARFGWHREALLRAAAVAFGHRLMMDAVVPGGVAADIVPGGAEAILRALAALEEELPELTRIYGDYATLADRLVGTGVVTPSLVAAFAAGGFVGRAAGRAFDLRRSPGYPPYDRLAFEVPLLAEGDVDARVRLRLTEIGESLRLLRALLADLPEGGVSVPLPQAAGEAIGWAEGFRGDIWHWLRLEGGQIAAVFMRDPSWLQWPLLEAAIGGNIVADFPLCNKSFNCSYSGVDL
jgi:Ni,Fe-hydrogenase III large subunit